MLAINGGTPIRSTGSWPRWPEVGPHTLDRLGRVLHSGRWSISGFWMGERTQEQVFADRFAEYHGVPHCGRNAVRDSEYHGVPHCVPTANGSSALIIALEALDVGFGDEVIVPGLTWVAPA